MEKRILLAFLLSLAVMYGFRILYGPSAGQTPPSSTPTQSQSAETATPTPASAPQATAVSPPVGTIRADASEDVEFSTTLYTATLSNHGAVLKSFKPKLYTNESGKAIELIDSTGGAKLGWPLAIATVDPKLNEILTTADFSVKREENRIVMEFADKGIHARKEFVFDPENYELSLSASLTRDGKAVPHEIVWQSGFGDQSIPSDPTRHQVVYPSGARLTKTAISGLKEAIDIQASRTGVEDQYFLAMFLSSKDRTVKVNKQEYPGADGKPIVTSHLSIDASDEPLRTYIGPKDEKWLTKADPKLQEVIDYDYGRFFGFLAKPLMYALLWVHSYIRNFGWAIIVLTLVINIVLFPLRLKQQVSMQKMQKIQPQMKTLQDKYKKLKPNDPRRVEVQTQMMGLYKEHGVNPMSGCIPLLLQMPFLIAFWSMLSASIELRQSPWLLWIADLSRPDPYYILPILMAVSMLVQQKMTPNTAMDPTQAKMMMIMPIMMSVFFLKAQSGLVLYWLTGNLIGIAQQYFINNHWSVAPAGGKKEKERKKNGREE